MTSRRSPLTHTNPRRTTNQLLYQLRQPGGTGAERVRKPGPT